VKMPACGWVRLTTLPDMPPQVDDVVYVPVS